MKITLHYPDIFVPEENEYIWYCGIKLYKGKIITKQEAMRVMDIDNEQQFNKAYNNIEKQFKRFKLFIK